MLSAKLTFLSWARQPEGIFPLKGSCTRSAVGHSSVHMGRTLRSAAGRARGAALQDERLARSPPIVTGVDEAEGGPFKTGGLNFIVE